MSDLMTFLNKYEGEDPYIGPFAEMDVSRSSRRRVPSLTVARS